MMQLPPDRMRGRGHQGIPRTQTQILAANQCPWKCNPCFVMAPMLPFEQSRDMFSICIRCAGTWVTAPDGTVRDMRRPVMVAYCPTCWNTLPEGMPIGEHVCLKER